MIIRLENLKSMNTIRFKLFLSPTLLLLLSACTIGERFNTPAAINEECSLEMQSARTAVRLRDKGKPYDWLKNQLVPLSEHSSRLLMNMHEILDEVFKHTELDETIYPTYRFELCMRQLQKKPYPISLAAIKPGLSVCKKTYGNKSSANSTQCVIEAIDELPETELIDPTKIKTSTTTIQTGS